MRRLPRQLSRVRLQRSGLIVFTLLLLSVGAYAVASRLQLFDRAVARLQARWLGRQPVTTRLSAGDFPAGVSAPLADVASVPLRPTLIGFNPRGSSAALLLATGGVSPRDDGLFKTAYALEARAVLFAREEDLRHALMVGAEHGGVDMAAVTVDRLAHWAAGLRDAAPRTVLLLGRSRGQEAMAAVGVDSLVELKGKRLATYPSSASHYFALWLLSRVGLSLHDVRWVELASNLGAGAALREGKADAVVGLKGDVELAANDRGGKLLATSADAPHLLSTVLVARGEFIARYPDAVRRVIRGLLDAGAATAKDPSPAARFLGEVAPYLGDPVEAIKSAPPATLRDNLSFFGLAGEAPVTYDELMQSASELARKLGGVSGVVLPEDTRDLTALKFVSQVRRP